MRRERSSAQTFFTKQTYKCKQKDSICRYLRVKFASIVQECHADLLQPTDLTGVILKALKYSTADVACTHQTVLDLSCKERIGYRVVRLPLFARTNTI